MFIKKCIVVFFSCTSFTQACNFISVQELLQKRPDVTYIKCQDAQPFEYKPFPISRFPELQPHKGLLAETFILKIPNGQVYSSTGYIKSNNDIITDFFPHNESLQYSKNECRKWPAGSPQKIKGKVVVLTTLYNNTYFHWIHDVLPRLNLIDQNHIEYDWIYAPYNQPFMKESLSFWGIDSSKIIQPLLNNVYIEADELIVPSLVSVRTPEENDFVLTWVPLDMYAQIWNFDLKKMSLHYNTQDPNIKIPSSFPHNIFLKKTPLCSCYFNPDALRSLSQKLMPFAQEPTDLAFKKIFILRNNVKLRKVINQDEIAELFKTQGFAAIDLAALSIAEQIALFKHAEIIAGVHGSGFANVLFCKPGTKIIDIFQNRSESCFFYLCQLCNLEYYAIQTVDFNQSIRGQEDTYINPFIVQNFIDNHINVFTERSAC